MWVQRGVYYITIGLTISSRLSGLRVQGHGRGGKTQKRAPESSHFFLLCIRQHSYLSLLFIQGRRTQSYISVRRCCALA